MNAGPHRRGRQGRARCSTRRSDDYTKRAARRHAEPRGRARGRQGARLTAGGVAGARPVASGFEPVADAFERVLGGGRGRWGGVRRLRRWSPRRRSLGRDRRRRGGSAVAAGHDPLVFSGTKGLVATSPPDPVERGLLDLDAPVSRYWPELRGRGQGSVTVAVASHMAALPGLRGGFTRDDLLDGGAHVGALAPPRGAVLGAGHAARLPRPHLRLALRRARPPRRRPQRRTVSRGRGRGAARPRPLDRPARGAGGTGGAAPSRGSRLRDHGYLGGGPEPLLRSGLRRHLLGGVGWNEPAFHRAEIPGANAIGDARSLARLYAFLAQRGGLDAPALVGHDRAPRPHRALARGLRDHAPAVRLRRRVRAADGARCASGRRPSAFGHTGSGGSRTAAGRTRASASRTR